MADDRTVNRYRPISDATTARQLCISNNNSVAQVHIDTTRPTSYTDKHSALHINDLPISSQDIISFKRHIRDIDVINSPCSAGDRGRLSFDTLGPRHYVLFP